MGSCRRLALAQGSRRVQRAFPAEIIGHAVWLYFRFPLGLRMVEELLAARGIVVTHETVRQWVRKFGQHVWSSARQSQCFTPAILSTTSSRCHLSPTRGRPDDAFKPGPHAVQIGIARFDIEHSDRLSIADERQRVMKRPVGLVRSVPDDENTGPDAGESASIRDDEYWSSGGGDDMIRPEPSHAIRVIPGYGFDERVPDGLPRDLPLTWKNP
jgi:hypothetical protein